MKLKKMIIGDFKGIKYFEVEFSNQTVIKGENGAGKTTVYDAFLWLLFGKNSEGKADFQSRPLNKNNKPRKGLVITVQAYIEIDGTIHKFLRKERQKFVNDEFRGNETLCFIDEVPKKVGEYAAYIDEIIAEDVFKLLTDLKHFCGKLHWQAARDVLKDIAGDMGTPEGFAELMAELKGRTIKEYQLVLTGQKKRLVAEQKEVNPRIDELQRQLSEYADTDTSELENQRGILEGEIQLLDTKRQDFLALEDTRQDKLSKLNTMKMQLAERVADLRKDTSNIQKFLGEKATIERGMADRQQSVEHAVGMLGAKRGKVDSKKSEIELKTTSLDDVRGQYDNIEQTPASDKCFSCNRKLPPEKIEANAENKTLRLGELEGQGKRIHATIKEMKDELGIFQSEAHGAGNRLDAAKIELQEARDYRKERFVKLNALIETAETLEPEGDVVWLKLNEKISKLAGEIGESAPGQLNKIADQRNDKVAELEKVTKALSQSDQAKANKERIAELEDREKELAQLIADIDKQLKDIADYKTEESNLLLEAVNGKFEHVEFKLFNVLVNGEIEDCCEATLAGVPYSDMSYGQRIFVGIDIVNVLSEHYGVSVPIFIDNAEGLTLPIEAKSQVIELRAVEGQKELTVESKE